MRSRKSFEVFSPDRPGRAFIKTMFLFGLLFLTLIRSQPRGMLTKTFVEVGVDEEAIS
jgi:hypothetical protein